MNIAIEAQRILRPKRYGMDIVALELMKALVNEQDDNRYTILTAKGENKSSLPLHNSHFNLQEGGLSLYPLWEQFHLQRELQKGGYDVAHFTANTAPLSSPVPSIVTLHDVIFLDPLYFKRGGSYYQQLGSWYRKWLIPKIINTSDLVVTVSEYERDHILQLTSIEESRLRVVYNGVSEQFHPVDDKRVLEFVQKRYNLPQKFALFFGNSDGKKNSRRTIEAFIRWKEQRKSDLSLVVTNLSEKLYHTILQEIGIEEAPGYIRRLSFVDHSNLPALYSLATLYLYPSIAESFGLSIVEAMRCGTPVVTGSVTSMPEIGGDAAIYVNPFLVDSISMGIDVVYNSIDLQEDMRRKGFRQSQKFSWKKAAKAYMDLYKEVA